MATETPDQTNPYLNARREWNGHVSAVVSASKVWQGIGLLSLTIAAIAVGGVIYIGSQSKFIPYVVEVDKLGQTYAVQAADVARPADPRVIRSTLASFINDARLVTPDVMLQREAIFRLYSHLSPNDPALAKMNEWLNGNEDSPPFKRAEKETVNTELASVLQQSENTWQVDWVETTRDRAGAKIHSARMRAMVFIYFLPPSPSISEDDIRKNPLNLFIKDFSWTTLLISGDKP